ncbi:MAG: S9 family peptidase [Ignavibacteriaceae bacterium]|nr:S9 family peptidase [Ignavibacteria bacterium]NNL21577.1 S9 family peptidase [Ignavibacteriaceae bacterium]
MTFQIKLFIALVLGILILPYYTAAQENNNVLTLERIYKDNDFELKEFGPAVWLQDGSGYTTLEESDKFPLAKDIIKYNPKTGKRDVLVDANQLIPAGVKNPLLIKDYTGSIDGKKLLIFTNTVKVWRYETRGDYWVLDLASGKLSKLGEFAAPSTLMFAKFSPDAKKIGYVVKNNIFVENLISSEITQLTHDGSSRIINGTFDWVYEEELSCRDGFRWSPDSKTIAYWQSDTEGTGVFYLINNIDSIYSKPIPFPYPKTGTTNSAVKVGVVSAEGGETKWFDIPGDPRNNYLARMDFIPYSNEVMIQQLNRLQNTNRVWVGNIKTMELTNILIDIDEAFLNIYNNMQWLYKEKYFTWTSEKDGWRHLYLVSSNGSEIDLITEGDFDVVKINSIDEEGDYVYYIASPENFTQRYLYRSRLDGTGTAERISPMDYEGQFSYQMSPDAKWAIATFQNSTTPNRISVISLPDHKEINVLEDNAELKEKYEALGLNPREFFKIDIGEVVLDAWMIKPAKFDPSKKYPVIFFIYGEPASSTVQDEWKDGRIWDHYLAQQGYIIISIDNRGTKTPRGRDWRKSIYKQIGILAAHDQEKAAIEIFKMFSFIDKERIGMWGWSGGGQMTMNCMFRYPEIYKTGIAIAFVSDQRLYDTIYQERYMDLPSENKKGYHDGSPITHASKLEGNLMIIHGTADDNVHYQSFEMLADELIKHNKLFSMMSYPMRSHSINEGENTSLHLRRTMEKYWKDNLIPGGK